MPIRVLPLLLVNQIAAGEVIERPASVVKELVENSLDAGAKRIEVAIEEGGRQLIRVSDDGNGIAADELTLAVAPHATSKLQHSDDLACVATLGFRGEALASIASVSRLRITSRARVGGALADAAALLEVAGDQVTGPLPAASSPGTIIEVADLFFNTPARRKFLRSPAAEFGHINEMLGRIALCWEQAAFILTHNGRSVLNLPAGQSRKQRCLDLLGRELEDGLLELEYRPPPDQVGVALWGLAGVPSLARATSKFQYLCLNGRPIRDRNLNHAMREAYRGLIPPDKHPMVVLMLELDPTLVDVNVHPAKTEVRFHDAARAHSAVLAALRQRLLGADLTPRVQLPAPGTASSAAGGTLTAQPDDGEDIFSAAAAAPLAAAPPAPAPAAGSNLVAPAAAPAWSPANQADQASPTTQANQWRPCPLPPPPPGQVAPPGGAWPGPAGSERSFVDYFRKMDPRQKGFVFQQVKEALAEDPAASSSAADAAGAAAAAGGATVPVSAGESAQSPGNSAIPASGTSVPTILQVHQSYLVTQDDQGILIIDQHALHERVMFEELRQRVLSRQLESQRLLMPTLIQAGPRRQALLEQLRPLLEQIGIDAQPMGPQTVAIHAFPSFLFDRRVEPGGFLQELLDQAEDGKLGQGSSSDEEAALHQVLDMMACKAAVKAGDRMTHQELTALLQRRQEIERSSNCPHGRPTSIRLTLRDLEKQFKRT